MWPRNTLQITAARPRPPLRIHPYPHPPQVMAGQLKTGEQIREELKASIASLLQQRGGSSELALPEAKPAVLLVSMLTGVAGAGAGRRWALARGDLVVGRVLSEVAGWHTQLAAPLLGVCSFI